MRYEPPDCRPPVRSSRGAIPNGTAVLVAGLDESMGALAAVWSPKVPVRSSKRQMTVPAGDPPGTRDPQS